ncbi:cytochrome c oxidase assembly protein [Pseudonocardia endophytica]|uniref:Cytochrome c oxidase assembly factor CtaG n=1 Tax=Pseudonocardia endophytica TaxID=401976 RepID=A0A4R1HXX7_PSEEN|nr:cytochrome c oxidase assembly protein [Pseudonocardia endophytica]TCK24929.1 cytochrome c oxidase assembly factor CtaG [Pseudonocardia endophytica]
MVHGVAVLPPLTLLRVATAWRFSPGAAAAMAALAGPYAAGVRRLGRPWERRRVAAFAIGVGLVGVVGMSFVGVYDDTLFWVRALQNLLLVMVVPLFLALGAPVTLLAAAVPHRFRPTARRWFHSRAAQVATFPLVVTLVLVLPLLVLYLSPLYEQTLRNAVVSGVVAVVLAVCGFLYFWSRIRVDPTPRAGSHLVTLWITIVEMVADAVLGVVLWLGPLVATAWYVALHRDWGPSLRTDQLLGAGVLWVGGDVVGLPFIGIVLHRFSTEDAQAAQEIDAELDRAEQASADGSGEDTPTARLWWEDDPQIADRFRRG